MCIVLVPIHTDNITTTSYANSLSLYGQVCNAMPTQIWSSRHITAVLCGHGTQGIAIPSLTMYSEDAIREQVADIVLDPSDGLLTFSDLGMTPQRIDIGIPLEHVRYYRVGGALLLNSECNLMHTHHSLLTVRDMCLK